MVEVYDSHEQGERVKSWLRENGSAIVMGLVLAFGGLFGFKQWQLWETSQSQQAAAEYEALQVLLREDRIDDAVANFAALNEEHADSAYVTLAALRMARARVDTNQLGLAIGLLETARDNAAPEALRVIVSERLARLYLATGAFDQATAELDRAAASDSGFASHFEELRGDIFLAQGERQQARAAYQRALELSEAGVGYLPLLEMKIDDLAGDES
ncbi:MAG: tetratricopeptide repeat protein [Xanthomonadales bacterium]|nr:tetratricopeptide repeat protein [Xanthomonadales bacterium]